MDAFIEFLSSKNVWDFIRLFWLYFLFEFPRYILLDYIVLFIYWVDRKINAQKYNLAKELFWSESPLVSIIVPGKDEGKHYHQLVSSLREQTYQNFELIVVDDGSSDNSTLIGRELERQGKIDLFLRNIQRGGKASAANMALRHANGEFIVHVDADCSFDRDAIENILIPFYYDEDIGAVSGNIEVRNKDESLSTKLQTLGYWQTVFVGRLVASQLGILRIVSGAFGAFRRSTLLRFGGWDVGPGLDGDITLKIRKLGMKIHFAPFARALTSVPVTFGKLARQRIRWSRSLIRFRLRKHSDLIMANMNFQIGNALTIFENIFYNLVLNFLWYVYLIDIIFNFTSDLFYILVLGYLLYTCSKFIEFVAILMLSDEKMDKLKYLPYIPAMSLYTGYFLRTIRTIAYVKEFIWLESFQDIERGQKSRIFIKR